MQTASGERRRDRTAEEELVKTQAELDTSRNEEEGLRRLNSAGSRSVSLVSLLGHHFTLRVRGV